MEPAQPGPTGHQGTSATSATRRSWRYTKGEDQLGSIAGMVVPLLVVATMPTSSTTLAAAATQLAASLRTSDTTERPLSLQLLAGCTHRSCQRTLVELPKSSKNPCRSSCDLQDLLSTCWVHFGQEVLYRELWIHLLSMSSSNKLMEQSVKSLKIIGQDNRPNSDLACE